MRWHRCGTPALASCRCDAPSMCDAFGGTSARSAGALLLASSLRARFVTASCSCSCSSSRVCGAGSWRVRRRLEPCRRFGVVGSQCRGGCGWDARRSRRWHFFAMREVASQPRSVSCVAVSRLSSCLRCQRYVCVCVSSRVARVCLSLVRDVPSLCPVISVPRPLCYQLSVVRVLFCCVVRPRNRVSSLSSLCRCRCRVLESVVPWCSN